MEMPLKISFNQCIWKEYLSTQEARLPRLSDVEDLTSRVIRIMGGNPGVMQLQGTNTYLVGTGQSRILIDTGQGMPIWAKNIINVLEDRKLEISHVLLTHWHGDHTGGVPDLISYNSKLASRIYKNQPDHGQRKIEDGQTFETEGATVRAVFTPGHAIDHMCFVLEEENALFTGDNILGHGYTVVQDLGTYMNSLNYMDNQNCRVGYPAHGVKLENLPQKIKECRRQKELREKQIYSALLRNKAKLVKAGQSGKGSLTIREIAYSLHGEVPDEVFELALEPFTTEVLWKLAEDRKVGFELSGGYRRWFINQRTWEIESPLRLGK
ncbi:Metallo-hydrolase/oxidoreductase [Glonium stellatum]|uniref:Metallo-hydrolase/oxidoreductase n=1 Tax=Glonium stellatum TaxID=574774 RepID=A0A8E2FB79_9PEZI|nr:Metallo-hydrolase/oxidoreductase [Glonium stellatum]